MDLLKRLASALTATAISILPIVALAYSLADSGSDDAVSGSNALVAIGFAGVGLAVLATAEEDEAPAS